jgi:hypothetical protein
VDPRAGQDVVEKNPALLGLEPKPYSPSLYRLNYTDIFSKDL